MFHWVKKVPKRVALAAAVGVAGPLAVVVPIARQAHVTPWGWFWLSWISVGVGVELYWLVMNAANTLSRQVWGLEDVNFQHPLEFAQWTPAHWSIAVVLWVFFGWLSVHFPFGWLR